jgi:hypothetical protein
MEESHNKALRGTVGKAVPLLKAVFDRGGLGVKS